MMSLNKIKTKVYDWSIKHAGGPNAKLWLFILSFAEASFFPIPPDIMLIAILGSRQEHRWLYYSMLTTVGSVLGGVFGYLIGYMLFDSIGQFLIATYNLEQYIVTIKELFDQNAFWAIFISGFTPIPYKIFTISAGFFGVNFFIFITASLVSRALRFFMVGYLMKLFGENMGKFVFKYFNILTLIIALMAIIFIVKLNIF